MHQINWEQIINYSDLIIVNIIANFSTIRNLVKYILFKDLYLQNKKEPTRIGSFLN